ncbi:uncharacterized protein LOC143227942 [Tachypleus tridentatus]|uniref:uncharacterized protein LOC143227942 n=1 Tax=Tachypleus tridentatus TaxID=6853 RepID=UPI003FD33523
MTTSGGGRVPSPDSACEQDWTPTTVVHGPENATSSVPNTTTSTLPGEKQVSGIQRNGEKPENNGVGFQLQDSDGDSGIVAVGRNEGRIRSSCSTETDYSQDYCQKKPRSIVGSNSQEFLNKCIVKSSLKASSASNINITSGPIKGDHSIFPGSSASASRAPPLSVHSTSLKDLPCGRVRFDEELQLTEHNIRRSCRKLFATLYAQKAAAARLRFNDSDTTNARLNRPYCPDEAPTYSKMDRSYPIHSDPRLLKSSSPSDAALRRVNAFHEHHVSPDITHVPYLYDRSLTKKQIITFFGANIREPCFTERPPERGSKFDKGLVLQNNGSSSSHISSIGTRINPQPSLFKSRSCTALPSETALSSVKDPPLELTILPSEDPLQSLDPSLLDNGELMSKERKSGTKKVHLDRASGCVLYSDDMIKVYARLASVVPEAQKESTVSVTDINTSISERNVGCPLNTKPRSSHTSDGVEPDNSQLYSDYESLRPANNDAPTSSVCRTIQETTTNAKHSSTTQSVSKDCTSSQKEEITDGELDNQIRNVVPSLPVKDQGTRVNKPDQVEIPQYAVIDKSKKSCHAEQATSLPRVVSNPCIVNNTDGPFCEEQRPPVPPKKFMCRSDFALYRGPPSSRKSLFERVQGITRSARSVLQKTFSSERMHKSEREETLHKSRRAPSFIKGLKKRMSTRVKTQNHQNKILHQVSPTDCVDPSGEPQPPSHHVWGQLIQLNTKGSQVIELNRPEGKPFGFFVARGKINNCRGVFVSRMKDHETRKLLSGLVDIGDEIQEIDGVCVKEKDIMEVNSLMAKKNTILLTITPYSCRQDIQ